MKIYFCDICNESVPQRDLDRGHAFLRKGRVVCATCDRAMGGELGAVAEAAGAALAPTLAGTGSSADAGTRGETSNAQAHPSSGAGAGLAMVMASMGILLTAGVAVLLFERMDQGDRRSTQDVASLRRELTGTLRELGQKSDATGRQGHDDAVRLTNELALVRARQDERARVARDEAERLNGEFGQIDVRLTELAGTGQELARQELVLASMADSVAQMRVDVGLLAEKLLALEERGANQAMAAVPIAAADPANLPSWMPLVDQLQSQSSGARWSAVQALGDTGDPAVADHVAPMLKDPDIFVRMATARILGDLATAVGVAPLIDALADPEASVREAAVVSLRAITAKNFKFDPTSSDADRAKKVKAWRDWWRREGDSFAGAFASGA